MDKTYAWEETLWVSIKQPIIKQPGPGQEIKEIIMNKVNTFEEKEKNF